MLAYQQVKLDGLDPSAYPSERSFRAAVAQYEARIRRLRKLLEDYAAG